MSQYERALTTRRGRRRPGENRAALLQAAVYEFGRRGYHGASTASIAARADVPQPHVYVHFQTKGELFIAALTDAYHHVPRTQYPQNLSNAEADTSRRHHGSASGASDPAYADREIALMHLQAVAALGEAALQPELTRLVTLRIETHGQPAHDLLLARGAEILLLASQE